MLEGLTLAIAAFPGTHICYSLDIWRLPCASARDSFPDFSIVRQRIEIVARHTPDPQAQAVYDGLYPVFLEAYNALVPVFDHLPEAGF